MVFLLRLDLGVNKGIPFFFYKNEKNTFYIFPNVLLLVVDSPEKE